MLLVWKFYSCFKVFYLFNLGFLCTDWYRNMLNPWLLLLSWEAPPRYPGIKYPCLLKFIGSKGHDLSIKILIQTWNISMPDQLTTSFPISISKQFSHALIKYILLKTNIYTLFPIKRINISACELSQLKDTKLYIPATSWSSLISYFALTNT